MSADADDGEGRGDWLSWPSGTARLSVLFCVFVAVVAGTWLAVEAISDAWADARHNADLSYADRDVGGGNSIVADQQAVFEARGLIPRDAAFDVVVGEPAEGWSELTKDYVLGWYQSDLIPRRLEPGAEWVICYACDRSTLGEVDVLWEGESGIAILRRTP